MNAVGRQVQRSGTTAHHHRQYSDNFIEASSNARWLQHLHSSNPTVPALQVVPVTVLYLCLGSSPPIRSVHYILRLLLFESECRSLVCTVQGWGGVCRGVQVSWDRILPLLRCLRGRRA